ncbi:MAG: hypothetical protein ABR589_04680 [Chthoniobacterales bacterium]
MRPSTVAESGSRATLLNAVLIFICVCGVADWLSAETRRLYVQDADASRQAGTISQRFPIRRNQVVPQIITPGDARLAFPLRFAVPHQLAFTVEPEGVASYEILLNHAGERKRLIAEDRAKSERRTISLPADTSELELIAHGPLAWLDLRLVRSVFLWPLYFAAAVGLAVSILAQLRAKTPRVGEWVTLGVTVLVSVVLIESVLRHYRLKLPAMIVAARAQFGLVGQDGRWVDPVRYKMRLREKLDTYAEWRVGDIARLGFIPAGLSRPVLHRYPIRTDAEGFRNAAVREKIDVAALGDSFTDGTTSPVEETWPARLEQLSGRAVQNYGTSAFGPQQARYVFQDFAAKHQPHWTVLAFFPANDLHDAEVFDDWERAEHRRDEELTSAKLAPSFRRYQSFYLWTIVRVAAESVRGLMHGGAAALNEPLPVASSATPRFDRGMFNVPVGGRLLQFAFFPPYLQKLGAARAELESTRGWELARTSLMQLNSDCAQKGSTFVLMLVPSKDQVYWPLAEASFAPAELQRAVDFYCRFNKMPLRIDDVRNHRLAINELLRDFCASKGIPMLDLTDALERELAAGREVFFPDDTHWNATGHDVAARELAKFLSLTP